MKAPSSDRHSGRSSGSRITLHPRLPAINRSGIKRVSSPVTAARPRRIPTVFPILRADPKPLGTRIDSRHDTVSVIPVQQLTHRSSRPTLSNPALPLVGLTSTNHVEILALKSCKYWDEATAMAPTSKRLELW